MDIRKIIATFVRTVTSTNEWDMSHDKPKLTGYSLKLCNTDLARIKIICAKTDEFRYIYNFFDAAVEFAHNNKEGLQPVANKKTGSYRSYYLNNANHLLEHLETHWDCSTTRALYTAVVSFITTKEKEHGLHAQSACIAHGVLTVT